MGEFFIPGRDDTSNSIITIQGTAMLTIMIFTAIILPLTLGSSAMARLISSEELEEMGVCLDNARA